MPPAPLLAHVQESCVLYAFRAWCGEFMDSLYFPSVSHRQHIHGQDCTRALRISSPPVCSTSVDAYWIFFSCFVVRYFRMSWFYVNYFYVVGFVAAAVQLCVRLFLLIVFFMYAFCFASHQSRAVSSLSPLPLFALRAYPVR